MATTAIVLEYCAVAVSVDTNTLSLHTVLNLVQIVGEQ